MYIPCEIHTEKSYYKHSTPATAPYIFITYWFLIPHLWYVTHPLAPPAVLLPSLVFVPFVSFCFLFVCVYVCGYLIPSPTNPPAHLHPIISSTQQVAAVYKDRLFTSLITYMVLCFRQRLVALPVWPWLIFWTLWIAVCLCLRFTSGCELAYLHAQLTVVSSVSHPRTRAQPTQPTQSALALLPVLLPALLSSSLDPHPPQPASLRISNAQPFSNC